MTSLAFEIESRIIERNAGATIDLIRRWRMMRRIFSMQLIAQEVMFARPLRLICNKEELDWDMLEKLFQILSNFSVTELSKPRALILETILSSIPNQIWKHRGLHIHNGSLIHVQTDSLVAPIIELLGAYRSTECAF
jgi:hypothetical protein